MNRRDFLKISAVQAAVAAVPITAEAEVFRAERRKGPSILQGATDETTAQFSIVHESTTKITATVIAPNGKTWQPASIHTLTMQNASTGVTKVIFEELYLGETFGLQIADERGRYLDFRSFQTLDLQKSNLRFAFCSCMDHERHEPQIWQELIDNQPDIIFFIGDSVYADRGTSDGDATPEHLWKKFSDARAVLEIYFSKTLRPIIGVWDDHDFGRNDSDKSYPYAAESKRNYETFFAQDENYHSNLRKGPGLASAITIGTQQFVLLDDRTFRMERGSNDKHAHWGREQEEWMYSQIFSHTGLTWIINGSQFVNGIPWKESIRRDHSEQLEEFLRNLRNLPKVILVSGDVHYSEISELQENELGYKTYEITSSSMHSFCPPGWSYVVPNFRRIANTTRRNYILVETLMKGKLAEVIVSSLSKGNRLNFRKKLYV